MGKAYTIYNRFNKERFGYVYDEGDGVLIIANPFGLKEEVGDISSFLRNKVWEEIGVEEFKSAAATYCVRLLEKLDK